MSLRKSLTPARTAPYGIPPFFKEGVDFMILAINAEHPQLRLIRKVVELLKNGGIIAYPTDTYYGIGCDIMNKGAIKKVYALKQREHTKPFSFICSDLTNISRYAQVTNYAYKTMKRLLPGPYTFVLKGSRDVPKMMLTKRKTAGIRVPDHAISLSLVSELGNPIISTSATTPDGRMLDTPAEIREHLGHALDCIIDGGPVSGKPSSVISLIDDDPVEPRPRRG